MLRLSVLFRIYRVNSINGITNLKISIFIYSKHETPAFALTKSLIHIWQFISVRYIDTRILARTMYHTLDNQTFFFVCSSLNLYFSHHYTHQIIFLAFYSYSSWHILLANIYISINIYATTWKIFYCCWYMLKKNISSGKCIYGNHFTLEYYFWLTVL